MPGPGDKDESDPSVNATVASAEKNEPQELLGRRPTRAKVEFYCADFTPGRLQIRYEAKGLPADPHGLAWSAAVSRRAFNPNCADWPQRKTDGNFLRRPHQHHVDADLGR